MSILVPVALIGWVIVIIILFFRCSPQKAVLISIFGGVLFLPPTSYDFPGLPAFSKYSIIAIGLLLGEILSGNRRRYHYKFGVYDMPMFLWCSLIPIASALTNNVGIYNGVSEALNNFFKWGVFFWAGRRYFADEPSIRKISWSFIYGGLLYLPLIIWEVRMSPRLNINLYGFFAHDWRQHLRYGGYRPIVFMESGLMVAFFMVAATLMVYWCWRDKEIHKIYRVPFSVIVFLMIIATILCKTAAAWLFLAVGMMIYSYYKKNGSIRFIKFIIIIVPVYIFLRVTKILSADSVKYFIDFIFDDERVASLALRLFQEDVFSIKALQRPLFGWGGMTRAWPTDPDTGRRLVRVIDSLWVILFGRYGFSGLISVFTSLGIGPWLVASIFRKEEKIERANYIPPHISIVILCLIIVFFMIDSLINAMVNPMYIFCSGALVSFYFNKRKNLFPERYRTAKE